MGASMFIFVVEKTPTSKQSEINPKLTKMKKQRLYIFFLGCFFKLRTGLAACLLFFAASVFAQSSYDMKGVVLTTDKKPITGATVIVKDTSTGTTTDANGAFSLKVTPNAILSVSFIGYESQEINVANKKSISIILKETAQAIDDVVVVGYGTVLKSDLTGAVATFKAKDSEEKGYTSMEQMLQGRIAGVNISQNSGALGGGVTFNIRGVTSVSGSSAPLVVIDGYPVEGDNTVMNLGADSKMGNAVAIGGLESLNPSDIESIEILKDASSTAIYGSRGANGVVLITTKRGNSYKDRVNYSYRIDFSSIRKKIDVLDTQEYIAYANEAKFSDGTGVPYYDWNNIETNNLLGIHTNWQDLIYQTGISQSHQFSIAGGEQKTKYAISANYLTQEGVARNNLYTKGSVRVNLDRDIQKWLKIGVNSSVSMSNKDGIMQAANSPSIDGSIVGLALTALPLMNAYSETGDILQETSFYNPLTLAENQKDNVKNNDYNVNGVITATIIKGLTLQARIGTSATNTQRAVYYPRGTYMGDLAQGSAYKMTSKRSNFLNEYTVNYNKTIHKKHRINAVLGYSWQQWSLEQMAITESNFINDNLGIHSFGTGASVSSPVYVSQDWALSSFIGRFNYSYDSRYLLTVTARYDGSSRLAPGNKWQLFPSVALGWNIHNEKFMADQRAVSEMKLRLSYGQSGNQSIAVGSTAAQYNIENAVINETLVKSYVAANIANKDLKWETTEQYNVGLDLGMFRNRLRFTADLYYKKTRDLLINLPVPPTVGYTTVPLNAGKIENKGMEFSLSGDIFSGKFNWTMGGNISFNRNKVLSFDGILEQFMGTKIGYPQQSINLIKVGYPVGVFYGYKVVGIYQTQEEIDTYAKDPLNPKPGSFKYANIHEEGDNVINSDDMTVIGNPYPKYEFGWTNDFSWKNLSVSILVSGAIGQDRVNMARYTLDALAVGDRYTNVSREAYEGRWTGPGTSNKYPAPSTSKGFGGRITDFIVEDASYVRLKNVSIAYDIPVKKIKFIKNLKVFVSGSNLLTFTGYSGYDPEVNSNGYNPQTPSIDNNSIPQFRTFSVGCSIGF